MTYLNANDLRSFTGRNVTLVRDLSRADSASSIAGRLLDVHEYPAGSPVRCGGTLRTTEGQTSVCLDRVLSAYEN